MIIVLFSLGRVRMYPDIFETEILFSLFEIIRVHTHSIKIVFARPRVYAKPILIR